jgi:reactive intermediate/imine deaminase
VGSCGPAQCGGQRPEDACSVGIGATAPLWAALAHRYLRSHFPQTPPAGRFVSLLRDAELDEGAIWEAIADPSVARLGELLWVVDLNRQSLDRVVPDIQIQRLTGMFAAAGWQVLTLKWGRTISRLFDRPGGAPLRERLETMPNEEYQRMLRAPTEEDVTHDRHPRHHHRPRRPGRGRTVRARCAGRRPGVPVGTGPLDPETGRLVDGDVVAQTQRVFANLSAVLTAAGLTFDDVVKASVYLTDLADSAAMNAVYADVITEPFPARTTVAVAGLPLGARVEIELVARA